MATRADIYQAILNADKAGDSDSVNTLGAYLKTMPDEAASVVPAMQAPADNPGFFTKLGRGAAALADNTVGAIAPTVASLVAQPIARTVMSADQAAQIANQAGSAIDKPFGKFFGVTGTPEYKNEASGKIMGALSQIPEGFASGVSNLTGVPKADASYLASLGFMAAAPEAARAVSKVAGTLKAPIEAGVQVLRDTPVGQAIDAPLLARQARLADIADQNAQARSAQSYQDGPKIDAANDMQRLGIMGNPSATNPTLRNRTVNRVTGEGDTNATISNKNAPQWTNIAKDEIGIDRDTPLTSDAPFDAAMDKPKIKAAYKTVAQIPEINITPDHIDQINSLRVGDTIGGGIGKDLIDSKLDNVISNLSTTAPDTGLMLPPRQVGPTGAKVLNGIRSLRQAAGMTYKQMGGPTPISPEAIAMADAQMGVANILEDAIDKSVTDPAVLTDFQDARTHIAKVHAVQNVTDINTGLVDPLKLAKITSSDSALTGDLKAMGNIAGNFPEIANIDAPAEHQRGNAANLPHRGVIGTTISAITEPIRARIATPGYQANNLVPADYRIPKPIAPEPLASPSANTSALFDPRNATMDASDGPQFPNFQMAPQGPDFGVSVPDTSTSPPRLPMLPGQRPSYRLIDQAAYDQQKAAETSQATREAMTPPPVRQGSSNGLQFDLDPITGRLVPTSAGIKGATPYTMADTSTTMKSAAEKVRLGQQFAMTPEERIAWSQNLLDLAPESFDPGYRTRSPMDIQNRIADRQFASQAILKAQQQAQGYDEIARRNDAMRQREIMMDQLTQLQEKYGMSRPVVSDRQGPITRAFYQAQRERNTNAKNSPP